MSPEQVKLIQIQAQKDLLNAYYVHIITRDMSREEILNSLEADRQFLEQEALSETAKGILKE